MKPRYVPEGILPAANLNWHSLAQVKRIVNAVLFDSLGVGQLGAAGQDRPRVGLGHTAEGDPAVAHLAPCLNV